MQPNKRSLNEVTNLPCCQFFHRRSRDPSTQRKILTSTKYCWFAHLLTFSHHINGMHKRKKIIIEDSQLTFFDVKITKNPDRTPANIVRKHIQIDIWMNSHHYPGQLHSIPKTLISPFMKQERLKTIQKILRMNE